MRYISIPVTPFQQNCSLVWCEKTQQAALIDAGGEVDRLLAEVDKRNLKLSKLLLTHGHLDHVGGVGELVSRLSLPVEGPHKYDDFWIRALDDQSRMLGLPKVKGFSPTRWLHDADKVQVGEVVLDVYHCPGHTPGHVVFFHKESSTAFVGDVLFKGSIGRTDFPRGDYDELVHSIRNKLFTLGDDVTFIPGHGPNSTLGLERRTNPFVADSRFG